MSGKKDKEIKSYPEGHFVGIGMAYGMLLGYAIMWPLAIALDKIVLALTLGPGIGIPLGMAIGKEYEKRNKDKIRPLTNEEKQPKKFMLLILVGLLMLGLFVAIIVLSKFF